MAEEAVSVAVAVAVQFQHLVEALHVHVTGFPGSWHGRFKDSLSNVRLLLFPFYTCTLCTPPTESNTRSPVTQASTLSKAVAMSDAAPALIIVLITILRK